MAIFKNKKITTNAGKNTKYKSGYNRDTCTQMFITALLTIAKLWKQPRYPITDEYIKKM
jgi:hypothetical protein